MALTDNCDIFASVHEKGFNNVVLHLQQQRPSLFNYGTISFVRQPRLFCNQKIISDIDPDVELFGNPIASEQELLSIPGYTGPFGLEYCFQLAELSIDFHPSNVHSLPAELNPPLKPQRFSLKGRACAGLACPGIEIFNRLAPKEKPFFPTFFDSKSVIQQPKSPGHEERGKERPITTPSPTNPLPFEPKNVLCFCLDLYVVLRLERTGSAADPVLALHLENLEIVDIKPAGLEDAIECYVRTVLIMGVLPKVKLALSAFVFSIKDFLTIQPTPVSGSVPFNPAIEQDQIKVFVNVTA